MAVRSRGFWYWTWIVPAVLLVPGGVARTESTVLEAVPEDVVFVYLGRPVGSAAAIDADVTGGPPPTTRGASQLPAILGFLNAAGLLPAEGQVFADIVGFLPLLGRHEHAVMLLDVSGRPVGPAGRSRRRSLRLEQMQAAIVLRTGGEEEDVRAVLRRIVRRYTNEEEAAIEAREVKGVRCERLSDRRLPRWAVWEWGRVGDLFVIGFGEGAFDGVAGAALGRTKRLVDDAWFRSAHGRFPSESVVAEWLVNFGGIASRLEEVASDRPAAVLAALGMGDVGRDLWAITARGAEIGCQRVFEKGRRTEARVYAGDAAATSRHRPFVPPGARRFAVLKVRAQWLIENVPAAVLAAQSPRQAAGMRRFWADIESAMGMDVAAVLRQGLGDEVIVCDYPPHPLGIPIAVTLAVPIRGGGAGDAEANRQAAGRVRAAVDGVLGAWSRHLAAQEESALLRASVVRAEDGVWYLQAGILGPALRVTDQYVVLSWSPQALREALPFFEGAGR